MRLDAKLAAAVDASHWFADAWASALAEIVEALALVGDADKLDVRAAPAEPERWETWDGPVWHALAWGAALGARLWVGCPGAVPRALWAHIGGAPDADADQQALETFREALNQAAALAAEETAARLGRPCEPSAADPSEAPRSGWAFELHFVAGGEDCVLALAGGAGLANALNPSDAGAPPTERKLAAGDPLELIREVHLDLAISFGDAILPLADVLRLASGAIIELNRSVTDPVEILVNDLVIARGDVVVVDGNYGVRITEIVSRRERVRSMF